MGMTEPGTATEVGAEQGTKEKLMEDLRAVVADAEELLKATANQTGERIAEARVRTEESLRAAKARLAEQQTAVMEKTKALAMSTEEYVRTNPWTAVGITAAACFVLGILFARR